MTWPAVSIAQAHAWLTAPGSPFEIEEVSIRGVPTRVWKSAPPTLRDAFVGARAAHGAKTFLVYEDERTTYEGFARAAIAVAHALVEAGVRKGDRVAIAMRNLPEWPVVFYGAILAGAIATPLNAWWTAGELEYGLNDSGARVLFADAERFERLRGRLSDCGALQRIWVSRAAAAPDEPIAARLEDLIGPVDRWEALPDRPLPDVPLQPEDDATIFYTSGTTGNSKGALGTHRNATCILATGAFSVFRNCLRRGDPLPTPDPNAPQKTTLLSVPFFHVTGCHAVLNGTLHTGGKLVLMHHWDAERAMQLIERERVTSAGGVPTIAWQIIEHPARPKYDLSSIESMAYGGAPAAPELVRRIREVFPTSAPGIGWGMSETSSTFTGHSAEDYVHRPDSSGPALPVCDMKVVGVDGAELPVGEVGELWVRGPNVVRGYWNKPEATAATFVDGWLRTGTLKAASCAATWARSSSSVACAPGFSDTTAAGSSPSEWCGRPISAASITAGWRYSASSTSMQ